MEKKYYQLSTHTESQWDELNSELTQQGSSLNSVPERPVECVDNQLHSPTRGTYLLTEQEAEQLKSDPRIKFINVDFKRYPETYKPPPEDLRATRPDLNNRYTGNIENYRKFTETLVNNVANINRAGYQLYRCQSKLDPWVANSFSTGSTISSNISQYGSGKHVDVIVGDDGTWFGHPEFQNNSYVRSNPTSLIEKPNGYVGGNVLPGNGTCDLLDLVLDSPYYIDPDWFNADPANRLTTRWDGTIVPIETVAREWWSDSTKRSLKFSSAGTVVITVTYTRADNNGTNLTLSTVGDHGTPCAALTYGRSQGWAYNSNKWAFNLYNAFGTDIEQGFDIVKLFHQLKPINSIYGTKNPTIMSNSWGYRSNKDPGGSTYYYTHRNTTNQAYTTETGIPWLSHMGTQGDSGRWKSEMKPNSYTQALDELINSGVIFVAAAGNSNQKQVNSSHPDFNNYITTTNAGSLATSNFIEFGLNTYGTTNRRGFPQQGGMYDENGIRIYPVINIGALDDEFITSKECKVSYSDRGESIDVYAPADGTMAANRGEASTFLRQDSYPSYRQYASWTDTAVSGAYNSSALLTGGSFVPRGGTAFSIVTSAGAATVTSIPINLQSITANPSTTPTSPTDGEGNPKNDEGYWLVNLPWTISYNGTLYNEIYIGTNSYATFGEGAVKGYNPLPSANMPALNKIMVSAHDNSAQRIYTETTGASPNRLFVIRFQGFNNYLGGKLGFPTIEYEYHFYENNTSKIELHVSANAWIVPTNGGSYPVKEIATDIPFSGTSAACPVAAGFIATVMEHNRDWDWKDVKNWLKNLDTQSSSAFYYGNESTTPTTSNWTDYNSLEGGEARVLYQGKIDARFKPGVRPVTNGPITIRGLRLKK